jgi:hypothetical protein
MVVVGEKKGVEGKTVFRFQIEATEADGGRGAILWGGGRLLAVGGGGARGMSRRRVRRALGRPDERRQKAGWGGRWGEASSVQLAPPPCLRGFSPGPLLAAPVSVIRMCRCADLGILTHAGGEADGRARAVFVSRPRAAAPPACLAPSPEPKERSKCVLTEPPAVSTASPAETRTSGRRHAAHRGLRALANECRRVDALPFGSPPGPAPASQQQTSALKF